jgi:hypothetical protein
MLSCEYQATMSRESTTSLSSIRLRSLYHRRRPSPRTPSSRGLELTLLPRRTLSLDCLRSMPNRQLSMTRSFDHVAVAAHVEAGVVGVVRIAGTGQVQPAQHGAVGLQGKHRAPVAGIDGDLAAAFDGQRLRHHHRTGIAPGGGRRVEPAGAHRPAPGRA